MRERGSTRRSGVLARRSTDLALDVILNSSTSGEISRTLDDRCLPVCCSVLQCVCTMLQCVAVRCEISRTLDDCCLPVAVCCSVLQCVAVCCSVLQCVAVCRSVLQCVASWIYTKLPSRLASLFLSLPHTECGGWAVFNVFTTLQHAATHCNTLQHTATHCNTPCRG